MADSNQLLHQETQRVRDMVIENHQSLRQEMTGMHRDMNSMREDITGMRRDMNSMREDITGMRRDINNLDQRIVDLDQRVVDLDQRFVRAEVRRMAECVHSILPFMCVHFCRLTECHPETTTR